MFQSENNVAELVLAANIRPPTEEVPRSALRQVAADAEQLGVLGVLLSLHEPFEPDEALLNEVPDALAQRLRVSLESGKSELTALLAEYRSKHGDDAEEGLRDELATCLFEHYELDDHGLFVNDVRNVLEVLRDARPGAPVKRFLITLCHLSRQSAKFILGLFPGQIDLIGRIIDRTANLNEIGPTFAEFAPRVFHKRLNAVLRTLLVEEKRFRLAYIIWCRMRGLPMMKQRVDQLPGFIPQKGQTEVIDRLVANAEHRGRMRSWLEQVSPGLALLDDILGESPAAPGYEEALEPSEVMAAAAAYADKLEYDPETQAKVAAAAELARKQEKEAQEAAEAATAEATEAAEAAEADEDQTPRTSDEWYGDDLPDLPPSEMAAEEE